MTVPTPKGRRVGAAGGADSITGLRSVVKDPATPAQGGGPQCLVESAVLRRPAVRRDPRFLAGVGAVSTANTRGRAAAVASCVGGWS